MTCPQLYKGHAKLSLCRLTGQTCWSDAGSGEHCTRRIWYDAQIMQKVGLGAAMGQDVKKLRSQVPLL